MLRRKPVPVSTGAATPATRPDEKNDEPYRAAAAGRFARSTCVLAHVDKKARSPDLGIEVSVLRRPGAPSATFRMQRPAPGSLRAGIWRATRHRAFHRRFRGSS